MASRATTIILRALLWHMRGCPDSAYGNSPVMGLSTPTLQDRHGRLREAARLDHQERAGAVGDHQVAGAIAEVCQKGPPSMSVDDGAGAAVEVIEKRYASGG